MKKLFSFSKKQTKNLNKLIGLDLNDYQIVFTSIKCKERKNKSNLRVFKREDLKEKNLNKLRAFLSTSIHG